MQIGKMDQQIELQSLTETNNLGSLSQQYNTISTVWAEVISQKGSEAFEAARINARETVRVRIHDYPALTVKWRIVWLGQNYNVISIDRSQKRDGYLWFTAEVVEAS